MALFVQLDTAWPDNVKIMRVGLAGAGLHAMAMCLAKRTETDGVLHRSHLYRLGADDSLIDLLITEGLFDPIEYGSRPGEDPERAYVIRLHDWHDRNPSQAAIDASRATKLRAAKEGNHRRWKHEGAVDDCTICNPQNPSVLASDRTPVADAIADAKRVRSPESESESENIASDPTGSRSQRDRLWDALEAELGTASTNTARTNRGKTVKELLAVDATPADITARCTEYRRRFPNAALTDSALRKHWDSLATQPRRRDFLVVDGIVLSGPAAIA